MKRLALPITIGALALVPAGAHADGLAQILISKSIPESTVSVIDPETGSSSGGSTDVNVGEGDIIQFRFRFVPVPDNNGALDGMQGYLTEYIPSNTTVVGVRILSDNGDDPLSIPPRYPGLSVESGSGSSISQVYGDTGVFITQDSRLIRTPLDDFIRVNNGLAVSPAQGNNIAPIVGQTAGAIKAHNPWDQAQEAAFGDGGLTPFGLGSAVAGTGTFYTGEAGGATGPWRRIVGPGALEAYDVPGGEILSRAVKDTVPGTCGTNGVCTGSSIPQFDLTPLSSMAPGSLAEGATAVRIALGDIRVGKPGVAEVSLRVNSVPLDGRSLQADKNIDCSEITGGDNAKRNDMTSGPGAKDNAWALLVPSPACVFLKLKFDLTVSKTLSLNGSTVTWTIDGKNLSKLNQTGVFVYFGYSGTDTQVKSVSPAGSQFATCPAALSGLGLTCRRWSLGTLAPGAKIFGTSSGQISWQVGGPGQVTDVMRAAFVSNELPEGFAVQDVVIKQAVPLLDVTMNPLAAGTFATVDQDVTVTGTIANSGTGATTVKRVGVFAPVGWEIRDINNGGGTVECPGPFTTEASCLASFDLNIGGSRSISYKLRPKTPNDATGNYQIHMDAFASTSSFGGDFENHFRDVLTVPVAQPRTAAPSVHCPIRTEDTTITGTAPAGSIVRVYFNGILRGTTGGANWSFSGFTATFGELYGGVEVRATAQVPGQTESPLSTQCTVTQSHQCSDGFDNDGDMLTDFPADPGCTSPFDNSEENAPGGPECSDGVDNDGDGMTDTADPDCAGPGDTVEAPAPECSDGIDNGDPEDTLVDFPNDPGCHSLNDTSEADPNFTPIDVKARLLVIVDTSGSMNYNVCAEEPLEESEFTGGDGTSDGPAGAKVCPGSDVSCATCNQPGCGNGLPDDSRLFKVKAGLANVIAGFGEVDFGLMRFKQRALSFACPVASISQSGGWVGSGAPPCGAAGAGELLAGFSTDDNRADLLAWLDGSSNNGPNPPPHLDFELRGSGTTPLAGSLRSALTILDDIKADDDKALCRPYRVILLTDGKESCESAADVTAAASALKSAGVLVSVIGFATNNSDIVAQLNAIAAAGGTGTALIASDSAGLSAAISQIISETVLVEYCDGVDNNCNGLCDEGYNVGDPCNGVPPPACDNGQTGVCLRVGVRECVPKPTDPPTPNMSTSAHCSVEGDDGSSSKKDEVCNRLDDNCNGLIDEDLTCTGVGTEICNGVDDDGDGMIDEPPLPNVGDPCGPDIGECEPGHLKCDGKNGLVCDGAKGPSPEICDGKDNDCDTIIDGITEICYPAGATGCVPSPTGVGFICTGACSAGVRSCIAGVPGECAGAITPTTEICNGVDDDCDGVVDNGFNSGAACTSTGMGACKTTGILVCSADGKSTFCTAPVIAGSEEICNGIDDDCDGVVDEDPLGPPIGLPCGGQGDCAAGHFVCDRTSGTIVCSGAGSGTAETCNGKDDDCDGFIDEAPLPGMGDPCTDGTFTLPARGTCRAGSMQCVPDGKGGATMKCVDAVGPGIELCNGKDDDCDGMADDMAICPSKDDLCYMGTCVQPCGEGEFPCGFGQRCKELPQGRFCVANPCDAVQCDSGFTCNPETGMCEDMCKNVTCVSPRKCVAGRCVDCFVTGCAPPSICRLVNNVGTCTSDPCATVNCDTGKFCSEGVCVALTCTPACAEGSECVNGTCVAQTCDLENCRGRSCSPGQACDPTDGRCIADPCVGVACPTDFVCSVTCGGKAVCKTGPTTNPQGVDVLATGSGGFSCAVSTADRSPGAATWLLLGLVGLLVRRRRRR